MNQCQSDNQQAKLNQLSQDDFAVTYILDDDWHRFYERNVRFFPVGFRNAIMR